MNELSEIKKGIAMLYKKGDVVEMRVPRKVDQEYSPNISGFFDDLGKLAIAIYQINQKYKSTIYTTLNPIKRDWMAVNNKVYVGSRVMKDEILANDGALEPRMKQSALWDTGKKHWSMRMSEDEDILRRQWVLIDVDAGQPAGTNSSHSEHADTLTMAKTIMRFLTDNGFPAPALTNSGNGHHVYVRVDLDNSTKSQFLVRRFLKALGQKFNGEFGTAMVDEGMFNAGRITKATGTHVFKGPHSEDRPCRQSFVIEMASNKFASEELITSIAELYVLKNGETLTMWSGDGVAIDDLSLKVQVSKVKDFLDFYDIDYKNIKQTGGEVIIPCVCPNSDEHTMNGGEFESVVMIAKTGALSFCCQHSHCQELRSWKGLKTFLEERDETTFNWDEGVLFLNGKQMTGTIPQESIILEATKPLQREKAVKVLTALKPECRVSDARRIANEQGISERTLRENYATAGMTFVRRKDGDFLCAKDCT